MRALREAGAITPLGPGWHALWEEGGDASGEDYWIQTGDTMGSRNRAI